MTLHRYYIWCNKMRTHLDELIEKNLKKPIPKKEYKIEFMMYMSLWYGMLYVVIEGWKELELTDDENQITDLIKSNNVNLLKRYRNATFHYQKEYNNIKFEEFFREKTTVNWVRQINKELGRWFLNYYKHT